MTIIAMPPQEGKLTAMKGAFRLGDEVMEELERWKEFRLRQPPMSAGYVIALRMKELLEDRARRTFLAAMELANECMSDPDCEIETLRYLTHER